MTNNSQRNIDIPLNRRNRDYTLSGNIFVYSARARARASASAAERGELIYQLPNGIFSRSGQAKLQLRTTTWIMR